MLEREGRVIAVHSGQVSVRFEAQSACSGCRARKLCVGANSETEVMLPLRHQTAPVPGSRVRVLLPNGDAAGAVGLIYGIPLAAFAGGMSAAAALALSEPVIAFVALGGLLLGMLASRAISRHPRFRVEPEIALD